MTTTPEREQQQTRIGNCRHCRSRNRINVYVALPPQWQYWLDSGVRQDFAWLCYACDAERLVLIAESSGGA